MAKQKVETFPADLEKSNVANFGEGGNVSSAETQEREETKGIVDGWWMADARLAKAETADEAKALFVACFRFEPREVIPACSPAVKGESYLYRDEVGPMYGVPSAS